VTVAGGVVTDPDPPRTAGGRRRDEPAASAPARARTLSADGAEALHARLAAAGLTPPGLTSGDEGPLAFLVSEGRAVRAGREVAFAAEAFELAREAVVDLASASGRVTLAQVRDRLGISRKYAQAILEALDAQGVTRRVGDERVLRRRGRDLASP
jgi:selenocysteine-specific elongation factor